MSRVSSHSLDRPTATDVRPRSSDPPSRRSAESSRSGGYYSPGHVVVSERCRKGDEGGRLRVAKAITAVAEYIGTASPGRFDDSAFQHGDASDFPEIPGEEHRNRGLQRIRMSYNQPREDDTDDPQTSPRPRSRAVSFSGSIASRSAIDGRLARSRTTSPRRPQAGPHANDGHTAALQHSATEQRLTGSRHRSDTLEIPTVPHTPTEFLMHPTAANSSATVIRDDESPIIIVSNAETPFPNT